MPHPLDYEPPPDSSPRRGPLTFLCIAAVAGTVYFNFADFHAYASPPLEIEAPPAGG
jgi:hypothetical protein